MAYFTQTVKPVITASKQHAGNIADTQVLFDWTAFDIPKGGARLTGMTVLYRGKDGADVSPIDFELFFARSSSASPTSAPATLARLVGVASAINSLNPFMVNYPMLERVPKSCQVEMSKKIPHKLAIYHQYY